MSARDVDRNLARLAAEVGDGELIGRVECDQAYAQIQHEELSYKHPRGGKAKFLSDPLNRLADDFMRNLAEGAITENGTSELTSTMAQSMEKLGREAAKEAPIEWADLRNSMHPTVMSDGQQVYDGVLRARRLTDEELRLKARWRR